MMKNNKRAVSGPPPGSRNSISSAASAAAALAFSKKQQTDAINLSAAAAAAALRSHASTPVPIGEIQTKRMARRGSTASMMSTTGSFRQAFGGKPVLQRHASNSSMTERSFRSPSPGPGRSRAPSISSFSDVPVPKVPSNYQSRPGSYDPPQRLSMTSPTPSTSSRLPPARKGAPGGSLPKVMEQREREYVESNDTRRSANFSRPMSPGPTSTAPREAVRMRPASSQGFYSPQNARNQPQQGQPPRQAPVAKNVRRAESILEESGEGPSARMAASPAARPLSTTPRAKTAAAPMATTMRPVARGAGQTTTKQLLQQSAKTAVRPTSTMPQSNLQTVARPASAVSQPRTQATVRPTSAMAQSRTPATTRPISTMPESRTPATARPASTTPQSRTQATSRPASAMAQSRTQATSGTTSAMAQPRPQVTSRPSSAMAQSRTQGISGPTSAMAQPRTQVTSRPASAMAQPRTQATSRPASAMSQTKTQPPSRPSSAMAQSRSNQPAWPPSALVQQTQQQQQAPARPSSAMSQTRSTLDGASLPIVRSDATGRMAQMGPSRIATDTFSTPNLARSPSAAGQAPTSPITIPSPTQEQMRVFQTRAAAMLTNSPANVITRGRAPSLPIASDRQAGPYQTTTPVTTQRTSSSSVDTQNNKAGSQSLSNLAPAGVTVKRTPSASPARSARFSSAPLLDTVKHQPPPRAISPAKSSLKPASLRTSSPESSHRQGNSDNSDARSVRSVESKKKPRVNFDETPTVLAPANGVTLSTKSMWMAEPSSGMSRTPALPSFESIRGRKTGKEPKAPWGQPFQASNAGTEANALPKAAWGQPFPSTSTGLDENIPEEVETYAQSAAYVDHVIKHSPPSEFGFTANGLTQTMEERKQSTEDVPEISVLPATPRAGENLKLSAFNNGLASIVDDNVVPPFADGQEDPNPPFQHSRHTSQDSTAFSGAFTQGPFAPRPDAETSFAKGSTAHESDESGLVPGPYVHGSRGPNVMSGEYIPGSIDPMLAQTQASERITRDINSETHEMDLQGDAEMVDNDADGNDMGEDSEVFDGENKTLSAIIETPPIQDPGLSQTHPAFRASNLEDHDDDLHAASNVDPEVQDWERVRAYWSSLSEQRKQQLEHEAGIVREDEGQFDSGEMVYEEHGRFEPNQQQSNQRFVERQAPLPPWPDQQYQQSVKNSAPRQQSTRPGNQRVPSDSRPGNQRIPSDSRPGNQRIPSDSKTRPQSAMMAPRTVSNNSVRPASISGNSPSKTAAPRMANDTKPLKGVLKNANAPQPPMARTFSNKSSDSDSSFRKQRQARKRGSSNHSMKKSMRPQGPPGGGSYEGRPKSPTPTRGTNGITSPLPSENRPLRTSMRGAAVGVQTGPTLRAPPGTTVRAPEQNGSNPTMRKSSNAKGPSKTGSRFKSRFGDDSSDEDGGRAPRRKAGGSGGFRSRFVDSDDEDTGGANGHAQGSSLMSGTMRNSVDGGSPQKRKLFGGGRKKNEGYIHEETESAPTSPARYSKMLGTMRQPEQDQSQSSSRPNVFRRISLSRSAQTIPGVGAVDESYPVPAIPHEYTQDGGGIMEAQGSPNASISNGRQAIVSSRTGKKKRFQGLRRVLGLND